MLQNILQEMIVLITCVRLLLYKFMCIYYAKNSVKTKKSHLNDAIRVLTDCSKKERKKSMPSDDSDLKVPSSNNILDLDQSPDLTPSSADVLRILDVRHDVNKVSGR